MSLTASPIGLKARLELSKAKHRSLAGHPRIARFVASLVAQFVCPKRMVQLETSNNWAV